MPHEQKVVGEATDEESNKLKEIAAIGGGINESLRVAILVHAEEIRKLEVCRMEIWTQIRERLGADEGSKLSINYFTKAITQERAESNDFSSAGG